MRALPPSSSLLAVATVAALLAPLAACREEDLPDTGDDPADADTAVDTDTADTADTGDDCSEPFDPARGEPTADMLALTTGQRAFAWELHRQLPAAEGNVFWSPFSVSAALAMLYGGTRGETATQLATALHVDLPDAAWHAAWGALLDDLGALDAPAPTPACPGRTFSVANRTWFDDELPLEADYVALTSDTYGAPAERIDFTADPEAARQAINAWVADRTLDHIPELLRPEHVSENTRFALVNALYFAGSWSAPFEVGNTADLPFTRADATTVDVPTMRANLELRYAEVDGARLVELPYAGDDTSMVVLLPDDAAGLPALEAALTGDVVEGWIAGAGIRFVDVSLPRFEVRWRADLPEALEALGVVDAFVPALADLTGMTTWPQLHVSAVVHEGWVKVDEIGTEAAAATAVMGEDTSAPEPATFHADRPFLFLVRDRVTGAVLFVGKVVDPSIAAE